MDNCSELEEYRDHEYSSSGKKGYRSDDDDKGKEEVAEVFHINMMADEMRNELRLLRTSVLTPMVEKENT